MSNPHPHSVTDLALAPVLINIERYLAQLRDSDDLEYLLALELNDDNSWYRTAGERAHRIAEGVTRNVELHGWAVSPTSDLQGLAVVHGDYTVSVMLGKRLADYVEFGALAEPPTSRISG
ncbi:MAG: hypothetical protein ACM3ML_31345 [Micromonosporaceae bacterium]